MKRLQLIKTALFRDLPRRILISAELIVALIFLFLSTRLLMKSREIDLYMELYGDMAAIDPKNEEQQAYAEEHGILFTPTVQLQTEPQSGKTWYGEINSLAYYMAVPLNLSAGSWFTDENYGCTYNAVVPYSLRNRFSPGKRYELSFLQCGTISFYICGVLDSDITFGNSYNAGFDDASCHILLCPAKNAKEPVKFNYYARTYVKLRDIDPEALQALDIDAVCLMKEVFHQGNRQLMAAPIFLTIILLVLFGTALIGDHFLSAKESEKTLAIYFLCGASIKEAVLLQVGVNFAEVLLPYLLSLAAALIIPIRLHAFSVFGILLILFAGCAFLSLIQMVRLRRESPSKIIARRFRG